MKQSNKRDVYTITVQDAQDRCPGFYMSRAMTVYSRVTKSSTKKMLQCNLYYQIKIPTGFCLLYHCDNNCWKRWNQSIGWMHDHFICLQLVGSIVSTTQSAICHVSRRYTLQLFVAHSPFNQYSGVGNTAFRSFFRFLYKH